METLDYESRKPPPPRRGLSMFWASFGFGAALGLVGAQTLDHVLQRRRGSASDGGMLCAGVASLAFLAMLLAAVEASRGPKGLPAWVALASGLLGGPLPLLMLLLAEWFGG